MDDQPNYNEPSGETATNEPATDVPTTDELATNKLATNEPIASELDASEPGATAADFVVDSASHEARAIEAILMVADQPVSAQLLGELLEIGAVNVDALCTAMAAAYAEEQRGFVLVRVAGGYRFQSAPEMSGYVERFVLDGQAAHPLAPDRNPLEK